MLTNWQQRLLPLMVTMLVCLTMFFCIALSVETFHIQKHIEDAHEISSFPALDAVIKVNQTNPKQNFAESIEVAQLQTMALLESNALQSRYHEATIALLIRICIVFLGFLTGMVLALVGAAFILGKLRESDANLNAQAGLWKVSLTSASPGLVLAILGSALMLATITATIDVNVKDANLYLSSTNWNAGRTASIDTVTHPPASVAQPPGKRSELIKEIEDGNPK